MFYFPGNTVLSAPAGPILEILTPEEGTELDTMIVEFTGRISDDLTQPENLNFKVYEMVAGTEEPLNITDAGEFTLVNNGDFGEWSYLIEYSHGSHTLLFRVEDEDSNHSEVQFSFMVNQPSTIDDSENQTDSVETDKDPLVIENEEESEDNPEKLTLSVEQENESKIEFATVPRPFVVSLNILPNGVTNSEGMLPAEDMTNVPVNAAIEMIIKESGDLLYSTEPLIITSASGTTIKSVEATKGVQAEKSNGEYRVTFTPTKSLEYSTTYYVFVNPVITNDQNGRIHQRYFKFTTAPFVPSHEIHGNFGNNTNSCANCHSTHNGNDEKLLGGKYGAETAKNLCMSCHDGTNGAPIPDHYDAKNQHFNYTEGLESTYSCTTCHNPHTSWTEENPNKIKNHPDTTYRKQGTAMGISSEFSLCLQCHNGSKAVDIKKYYEEEALLTESGHNITAEDGTSLNGQLTCADCHETHGSDNLKMLKGNLGNAPLSEKDQFQTKGTEWTIENERNFCLKCHNGNTELYGKNPVFNPETETHQDTKKSCSSCHGTGKDLTEQMRSAAHAPKRIIAEISEDATATESTSNKVSAPQTPESISSKVPEPQAPESTNDKVSTPQTLEETAVPEATTEVEGNPSITAEP